MEQEIIGGIGVEASVEVKGDISSFDWRKYAFTSRFQKPRYRMTFNAKCHGRGRSAKKRR